MTHSSSWPAEFGRFAKAQVSTGVATLAEWMLVLVLARVGTPHVSAAITGAVVGGGIDFAFKKWWVFATHRMPRHAVEGRVAGALTEVEAVRYAVVSGLSALWYGAAIYALVDVLHWPLRIAVVGGSVLVGLLWNYPLHRYFVFSRTSGQPA